MEQKSNFSKYNYRVKGILDNISHYRLVNSTIIVKNEDVKDIKKILDKYSVKSEVFEIRFPENKLKK